MKEIEGRKQSELMASQQLKKMIPQLLLSVSLFSFVFSYSSFYSSSSLLYSSKFHYLSGTNSFHFLSHALNKNCLFLICNGLLVFLAKTSGFIRPPSEHHDLDEHSLQKSIIGDDMITAAIQKFAVEESGGDREITEVKEEEEEEMEKSESPEEVAIFIAESEEEGGGGCDDLDKDENDLQVVESRRCWLYNDDDDDDQQQLYDEELEDDDDDDEREEMSTEELNQKFEEFIRRMKKEILINEARQRSVVMVN